MGNAVQSPAALFPAAGLRGGRVALARFEPGDITDAYVGWLNDPRVMRYSNQRFRTHDRASCSAYLGSFAASPNLFLAVRRLPDGVALGTMTAYFAPHHGTVDVGILIGEPAAWGSGYGSDAWCTLLDWLLGLPAVRKVTAGALACNAGMLSLMRKAGMVQEAIRRRQEIVEGRAEDIVYYCRFRDA
jgi:RimJ/RimL family protein N-acetyltransferase